MRTEHTLVALMLVLCVLTYSGWAAAVPLAEWEADEAKLLGEEPVTRADLPDEWQQLTYYEELVPLLVDTRLEADTHFSANEFQQAQRGYELYLYLARFLKLQYEEAKALNELGLFLHGLSQYGQALDCHERSLGIRREIDDQWGVRTSLSNIARVYYDLGQYAKALEHYEESLAVFREIADIRGESTSLNGIGLVLQAQGQYEKALDYYEQSLAIAQEQYETQEAIASTSNIALVYAELGQYEQALEYYEHLLAFERQLQDRYNEGTTLNNIGIIYDDLGQYEDALTCHEQSLAISRDLGDQRGEGISLSNIGGVHERLGQYEEALAYYERSLGICRAVGDLRTEGTSLNNVGAVYASLGQFEEALTYYEQSLAIIREIGDVRGEGTTLNNIGSLFRQSGWPEQAVEHYRGAFDIAMSQATQFTWESGMKGGLVDELVDAACLLASTQLLLDLDEDAFVTVQSAKGVPLLQLLMQADVQVDDPAVEEALSSYRDAQAAMQKYRDDLYRLDKDDEEQRAYIYARIEDYQAQASDAWDYIRAHEPRLTEIIEVQGLSAEQVQQEILRPGQVVLEYMQVDGLTDDDPGSLLIFCLPWEGELTAVRIALPEAEAGGGWRVTPNSEPEDEDRSFERYIKDQLNDLYGAGKEDSRQAGRELYELLVAPVAEAIPPGAELIICPDRSLFLVPFEALVGPEDEYLLERHPLTYSTSATMLHYIKDAGGAAGALVAGVSFSGNEGGGTRSARDPLRAGLYRHRDFGPLPAVPLEARNVAAATAAGGGPGHGAGAPREHAGLPGDPPGDAWLPVPGAAAQRGGAVSGRGRGGGCGRGRGPRLGPGHLGHGRLSQDERGDGHPAQWLRAGGAVLLPHGGRGGQPGRGGDGDDPGLFVCRGAQRAGLIARGARR